MKKSLQILGLSAALTLIFSLAARATTYTGNGGGGFGDPVGSGMLTLTTDGTTLTGTTTQGGSSGFNDELVIYIDDKAGGLHYDLLVHRYGWGKRYPARAVSGLSSDGTNRATLDFSG